MDEVGMTDPVMSCVSALAALGPAVHELEQDGPHVEAANAAARRGHFIPAEEAVVRAWFARFLTARAALLEVVDDLRPLAKREGNDADTQLAAFVVAQTAACLLVHSARYLVGTCAHHKVIQRKLNEADPARRVPRKQYTAIYRSLTHPAHAWELFQAMRWADTHRDAIDAAGARPPLDRIVPMLRGAEDAVRVDAATWLKARLRYRWHAWRRRRASATQQGSFAVLEACGRVIADVRAPWHRPCVTESARTRLGELLQPGDVIVTRHHDALSNLFLPGYWPHSALHVGSAASRDELGVVIDPQRAERWCGDVRVLEARKDGVLFRPLADTLAVDAVAVIRPRLSREHLATALARAATHEGKLYNFDFDFFASDRLVCTEVVYRGFEGAGGMHIPLSTRSGRPTLSSEDLLRMALAGDWFDPVAVFGPPGAETIVVEGEEAAAVLEFTLQSR